jgi:hypothetical protein
MLIKPKFGPSPSEKAEQVQRARVQIILSNTFVFVTLQIYALALDPAFLGLVLGLRRGSRMLAPASPVLAPIIAACTVGMTIAQLSLLIGRSLFLNRTMRSMIEDETTLAHRRTATAAGYWAAMLAILAVYVCGLFEPLSLGAAVHLVLIVGVSAPLLLFAFLEWRAARE